MHKRVKWRHEQKWREVRKAVRHFKWVLQHACPCCDDEWVNSAEDSVWRERARAKNS